MQITDTQQAKEPTEGEKCFHEVMERIDKRCRAGGLCRFCTYPEAQGHTPQCPVTVLAGRVAAVLKQVEP